MLTFSIARPGIALCALQPFENANRVEGRGALESGELVPADRHRYRSAFAGSRRIGKDGGGAAFIAQPVDEDAPLALGLACGCDEAVGVALGEAPCEPCGKGLDLFPVIAAR